MWIVLHILDHALIGDRLQPARGDFYCGGPILAHMAANPLFYSVDEPGMGHAISKIFLRCHPRDGQHDGAFVHALSHLHEYQTISAVQVISIAEKNT